MIQRFLIFAALAAVFSFPVHAQTITDPGFETPAQGQGKFTYAPAGSAWTFFRGAGLAGNGSPFTSYNPVAPQGAQVCFLQGSGQADQLVKGWPAGDYEVSFKATQRAYFDSHQVVDISIDGQVISTITPGAPTSYQTYYSAAFPVTAGDHKLTFIGTDLTKDNTALIDAIAIIPAGSIVPKVTASARVATSGKMIEFSFANVADGKPTTPTQLMLAPILTVNGQVLGRLGTQWLTGYHPVALLATPGAYQIRAGDRVQLSAPTAWAAASSGIVGGLDGLTAENRAGKPMLATEGFARTLRIGVNHNQAPATAGLGFYWPFKNMKYRVGWPPSHRGKLSTPQGSLSLSHNAMTNGIDPTAYPGMAGLWVVMWDADNAANPVQFSISSNTPAQATVTERLDLARAPPDGGGMCRVFDVQPITTSAKASFDVSLSTVDPAWTGKPSYSNLWVVQPGDWDIVAGQVVLDRSDPWALSPRYLDRVGPAVGSMRWVDSTVCGGNPNSCPYPEFLPSMTDENWGEVSFYREVRGYVSAGPVDVTATPYIYSPFFRQPGQSYTCTLGAEVTSTPAPGSREVWTITDGTEAPLMAGLELSAGGEVCRILSGSGTSWTVQRGSNGTTPATHQPGALEVSGRRPIRDVLNAQGFWAGTLVVQLTTREPHQRTLGNLITCGGVNWPVITYTDGSQWNLQGSGRQAFITGPNTLFLAGGSSKGGGVPTRVYPLNPDVQQWDYRSSGQIPIECAAIATGRFPKADFHCNVPLDAVDDMVYEIARRVLANFPAGRRVYVEYSNEPWNWAFSGFGYHSGVMNIVVPSNPPPYQLAHYAMRAGQVHSIFRSVFGAAGRAAEIHGLVNCQMGSGSTQVTPHLEYGFKAGTPFDDVAVAPYWSVEDTPLNKQVAAQLDDEQWIDVVGADQRTNPKRGNAWMTDVSKAISTYNQAHSANVKLYGYEGGIEDASPGDERRNHDLIYNPNWYFTELDWLAWCQQSGLERLNVYSLGQWWAPQGWGGYHTSQQRHSRGDGLNGAKDNRLVRARTKPSNVNHDLYNDAVRPQAWLDWLGTLTP
jgi:hypothetical protein